MPSDNFSLMILVAWLAPAATIIGALMTASNLGARITGWGFAIFVVASSCWSTLGWQNGQTNVLLANGFLVLVNAFGVWRWLGRRAKHEDGSKAAELLSRRRSSPSLVSAAGIPGAKVIGRNGEQLGEIVDAMLRRDGLGVAYVVIGSGGAAGVGETLRGVDPARLSFSTKGVSADFDKAELQVMPELKPDEWPAALPAGPAIVEPGLA